MIDLTDRDLDRPWVPENARPFVVGDRVRVRLSAECRKRVLVRSVITGKVVNGRGVGHRVESDGQIGTVIDWLPLFGPPKKRTHNILVRYDHPIPLGGSQFSENGGGFAAIELELIEAVR